MLIIGLTKTLPLLECFDVQYCSTDLVEENIFPVNAFSRKILENTLRADAMLGTELLPKLEPN